MDPTTLTEWARLTMATLADAGLRDLVVSPGSRSTPYIVAACNEPRLRLHSVIDERAAGFFALGLARVSGVAAAVLCTSGSAVAHYHPAVIEADAAGVPLLVLSADRPFELQAKSAPQTIDQVKIFGERVRQFVETGMPEDSPSALSGLRRALALAVAETARPGRRGPVHINLRARKPLEPAVPPASSSGSSGATLAERVGALLKRPIPSYASVGTNADPARFRDLAALLAAHPRGLIHCGPTPLVDLLLHPAVVALARATGYPVHAEASSMVRFASVGDRVTHLDTLPLMGSLLDESMHPTLVVHVGGASTFARPPQAPPAVMVSFSHHGVVDPENDAHAAFQGSAAMGLEALAQAIEQPVVDPEWLAALVARDEATRAVLGSRGTDDDALLQEGRVAAAVVASLSSGASLVLGNSLAIRSVELFCRASSADTIAVFSQRGANGIDGHVAFAAGIAAGCARPTVLLLGDVSLLHDLGSLLIARASMAPLLIVVLQNKGGRIFEQLPLAGHALLPARAWDMVTTPRHLDLERTCGGFGILYARAARVGELRRVLDEHARRGGVTLVEAVTDPAGSAQAELAEARAAVAASFSTMHSLHLPGNGS